MAIFRSFATRYPVQSVILILALLLAGVASSVGLSALLPLLNVAFDGGGETERGEFEQKVVDLLAALGVEPTLGVLLGVIVGAVFLKSTMVMFAETRIGYIAADVATELRMRLLQAVLRSRWTYFAGQSPGKLANAMSTEAYRASLAYVMGVRVIALSIESSIYAFFAFAVSAQATLLAIGAGVIILLVSRRLVQMGRDGGVLQTHWYRQLLSSLTDTLQSVKSFKAMGREHLADHVLSEETGSLRSALKREALATAALESAQEPMYAIVIAAGIFIALSFFDVQMATVTFLVLVLANLLKQVGKVQKQFQKMVVYESAYWSLNETIDTARAQAEPAAGSLAPTLQDSIRLEDVTFSYGEHDILSGAKVEIPAGQLTCLVGESGSGKTTITDLVMGLVRPTRGKVFVDGVDLAQIDLAAWRHQIGYVPQENLLLHASVLRNVTLGDDSVPEADVERALRAAGAWDFISVLPEGIRTVVGERGTRISGGQRQRIMIARALVGAPKLLILDEATSALDPESDRAIAETLRALTGELTILVVSHHSTLTSLADRVYRIERGCVALDGAGATSAATALQGDRG
ncbi:MAG: ABC transporter ATP-binding protein [Pseudomonadales bacterium]|jgi:ATP-binding cassette subfamily C protein|nr:ABC transporter ATP-binding protein [Pseudomonadales bacterium]